MQSTARRAITIAAFVLAAASPSPALATNHSDPSPSGHASCSGVGLGDGEFRVVRGTGYYNSWTCTDGEVCSSHGQRQNDGSWNWSYECHKDLSPPARTTSSVTRAARPAHR